MTALAAIAALPACAAVIYALLRTSLATRMLAAPRDDRWHGRATPTLGGVGIFAGFLVGIATAAATGQIGLDEQLLGILGGCAILFVFGLADDLWNLPPFTKLAAQLGATAVVLLTGLKVEIVSNNWIAIAIAVVWLVGMTNAFNLLDNMDGLAATLAAIACAFFAIDAVTVHPSHTVLAISASLGLACLGFLPFNLRPRGPALMFMGDSGSQVLGFALGVLGLASSYKVAGTTVATLVLPILILAVPILDTTLVTIVRLLEGRPVYQGGRDHSSHRLVYHGLSERRAVVLLAVIAAGLGATSLAYNVLGNGRITLVGVLLTFAMLVQFGSFLSNAEQAPVSIPESGNPILRTFVVHRRRLIESLVDFALVTASFTAAYMLRLGGSGTDSQKTFFLFALPVLLAARYAAFITFGLYRGVWRYAGARDATAVASAVIVSALVAVGFLSATRMWHDFPRSIFVIDALLCTILVGASRFWERAVVRGISSLTHTGKRRTLIVGAGRGGRSLLRELRETPGEQVVGFVDDNPQLRRARLQGVPVLGASADLERVIARVEPDAVLVTIPDAPRERLDAIVAACVDAGVE
ncbi:MAG: Gfo/Idh/MocA family oxidoreductase, partial [Actinomycetota bacterium]|nr:Gfo/Idh/MocA family oxidoreductase [Actinomycetota bacterium]